MYNAFYSIVKLTFSRNKKFRYELFQLLGVLPNHIKLYEIALIHKSASLKTENGEIANNERLEFLGDAILDSIIAEFLYKRYPERDEGFLTEMRSKFVNRNTLNKIALELGLSDLIVSNVDDNRSKNYRGDALEALIGALFLDKGFNKTKKVVLKKLINRFIDLSKLENSILNYKSRIIEWSQKTKQEISFEVIEENENCNLPSFTSVLKIDDEVLGEGTGNSKKQAEQQASKKALQKLNIL